MMYLHTTTSMEQQLLHTVTPDEMRKLQVLKQGFQLYSPCLLLRFPAYRYGLKVLNFMLNFDADNNYMLNQTEFTNFFDRYGGTKPSTSNDTTLLVDVGPANTTNQSNSLMSAGAACFSQFGADQIPAVDIIAAGCSHQCRAGDEEQKVRHNSAGRAEGRPSSTMQTSMTHQSWSWSNPFSSCMRTTACTAQEQEVMDIEMVGDPPENYPTPAEAAKAAAARQRQLAEELEEEEFQQRQVNRYHQLMGPKNLAAAGSLKDSNLAQVQKIMHDRNTLQDRNPGL
ncbi:unnamed protein product [Amoebophrya sp. A120]|nr:unnamed protein product [Amoebophrya sp. A120]|eukprot:GSA120T00000597001.1